MLTAESSRGPNYERRVYPYRQDKEGSTDPNARAFWRVDVARLENKKTMQQLQRP